jgi:hypothetical protein
MKNVLILSMVLVTMAAPALAQTTPEKVASATPHTPYTGISDGNIYYEDLVVIEIEEIYSSHYNRNIYQVISYNEVDESAEYITVTPDTYSYNWVYRLYTDYFYQNTNHYPNHPPRASHFATLPYYSSNTVNTETFIQPVHNIRQPQRSRTKIFKFTKNSKPNFKKTTRTIGRRMHPSRRNHNKKYVVKHKKPSKKMSRPVRRGKKTFRQIP